MTSMSGEIRVYLPLQPEHLAALQDGEELEAGLRGFTVTDQIRRVSVDDDVEEQEYMALQQAAFAARAAGQPVVIAAADVPASALAHIGRGVEGPVVELGVALQARRVASFHLDDVALQGQDADSTAASDEAIDLSWYDVSEVAQVLRHLTT
ncbi:MAG TPA: hypothetical protein VJ976_09420 [Ornithinimicrobium sp.]|uniref:DUF6912 family protein n=1 Tax=Ornithinimicrobium sp. TaxID=1977084 RepID=UPI002B4925CB|nr:hypothetical protein [Ornithinimicrobium sp.]HKJ12587.1 hypothetical protein [Ornithinimicrobium sp.]